MKMKEENKIENKPKVASIFAKKSTTTPKRKQSPEKKTKKSPDMKKNRENSPEIMEICETKSTDFVPNVDSYHPIYNACWKKGEKYVGTKLNHLLF